MFSISLNLPLRTLFRDGKCTERYGTKITGEISVNNYFISPKQNLGLYLVSVVRVKQICTLMARFTQAKSQTVDYQITKSLKCTALNVIKGPLTLYASGVQL